MSDVVRTEIVQETFQIKVTALTSGMVSSVSEQPNINNTPWSGHSPKNSWHVCATITLEEARAQLDVHYRNQYDPKQHKLEIVKVREITILEEMVIE